MISFKTIRNTIMMTALTTPVTTSCCNTQSGCPTTGNCTPADKAAITQAIYCYIEAGRKGDSSIARNAFTPNATMSWFENGEMQSVPIQELYDFYDNPDIPKGNVTYEMSLCNVADDVAVVRIESQFGTARYSDMFSLVKDADGWKIVSKTYHRK